MPKLVEIFEKYPYQSNLDGHYEEDLRIALERLEKLKPGVPEYWKLKGEVLSCIARNSMEQFDRGKRIPGITSRMTYDAIFWELSHREDEEGVEWEFF